MAKAKPPAKKAKAKKAPRAKRAAGAVPEAPLDLVAVRAQIDGIDHEIQALIA